MHGIQSKCLQFLLLALVLGTHSTVATWDFAVATQSQILFYNEHWSEVKSAAHQFDQLTAMAFDESEEVVYFSDRMHNNGSIFSLKLQSSVDEPDFIEKIVRRTKKELITGIAYDPYTRNIYWTDKHNKKIFYAPINAAESVEPSVFLDFGEHNDRPDGIAIDACRRTLYWTNSDHNAATIERINLDGSDRRVIIDTDLYMPHGIVVDQLADRIYWVVDQQGVHFSVESARLDGSDRHIIVRGLDNTPFNLAVTEESIFWTDSQNNAVWTHPKWSAASWAVSAGNGTNPSSVDTFVAVEPHEVLGFTEKPSAIVARSHFFAKLQKDAHCADIVKTIKSRLLTPKPTRNPVDVRIERLMSEYCLNEGRYSEHSRACICQAGFRGARCETSECHNFCVHGSCYVSSTGFPACTCQTGFRGSRCQTHVCTEHCLNDGTCKLDSSGGPYCECRDHFGGDRCGQNSTEICSLFCRILKHDPDTYVPFGCHDICATLSEQSEHGEVYALPKYQHLEVCKTTTHMTNFVIGMLVGGVMLSLLLVLAIVHGLRRFYKPARPRIKKTFVVRKQARNSCSDTPLTNRPLATEQVEITIENCCNMEICDTPCFDPKRVQQSLARDTYVKEDKKILVNSMEDELY